MVGKQVGVRERSATALSHAETDRCHVDAKLKVLEAIGLAIASGGPLDTVLEVLIELVLQAVPSEAATFFLVDPDDGDLVFAVSRGTDRKGLEGLRVEVGDGLVGWVVAENMPAVVNDVTLDARFAPWVDERTGFVTRSVLCVPLAARAGVIGAIELMNRTDGEYTPEDASYLAAIGSQIGQLLANVRLLEQQQRVTRMVYALQEAGRWLNSSLELARVLEAIVRMAGDVVKAEAGSVLLRNRDGSLRFEVALGPRAPELMAHKDELSHRLDKGVAGLVARTGEPQVINDCDQDERFTRGVGAEISHRIQFTTKNMLCVPMRHRDEVVGVMQLLNRIDGHDFDHNDLKSASLFADDAAAAIANALLYESLERSYLFTIDSLVTALDARDNETGGHSQRVALYAKETAAILGMTEAELQVIYQGSLLHDIGKIGIPDAILRKPGKLTEEEFSIMRRHTIIGYRILKGISFLEQAAVIPLFHHERYDGQGYLFGLAGDKIPLGARIFAVVDTFDAMTSDRVYRKALPFETARQEIEDCRGSQFDGAVADAFLSIPFETIDHIREHVREIEAHNRPLRADAGTEAEDYAAAKRAYEEMLGQGIL